MQPIRREPSEAVCCDRLDRQLKTSSARRAHRRHGPERETETVEHAQELQAGPNNHPHYSLHG